MAWTIKRTYDTNSELKTDYRVWIRFLLTSNLKNNATLQEIIAELQLIDLHYLFAKNALQWVNKGFFEPPHEEPQYNLEKEDKEDWVINRDPFKIQINCKEIVFDTQIERDRYIEELKTIGYKKW